MLPPLNAVHLAGFDTVRANRDELASWINDVCHAKPSVPAMVFSSNGQGIALYGRNAQYDFAMDAADVVHADVVFPH